MYCGVLICHDPYLYISLVPAYKMVPRKAYATYCQVLYYNNQTSKKDRFFCVYFSLCVSLQKLTFRFVRPNLNTYCLNDAI